MNTDPATKHTYRPDIDGLRAIAVLLVIVFHLFPTSLPGGFVGVDVFFVISGFLITSIVLEKLAQQTFSFADFYARRIKRILPALVVVILVTLILGWFVLLPNEFKQLGKHTGGAALFGSNFVLLGEAGYFDNASDTKPFLHLWSLAIEEQFYLIWPLLLLACHRQRIKLAPVIGLIFAASLAFYAAWTTKHRSEVFFLPFSRFWELLVGGGYATFAIENRLSEKKDPGGLGAHAPTIVGVLLILLPALFLTEIPGLSVWFAPAPCVGALLIVAGNPALFLHRRVLGHPLLVSIGLISYPLYLWHWPLIVLAKICYGDGFSNHIAPLLLITAVASIASYKLLEQPLRRTRGLMTPLLLLCMLESAGITGYFIWKGRIKCRPGSAPSTIKIVTVAP